MQSPFLSNFIDHPAIVQFIHRNIAYFLGLLIVVQLYIRRSEIRSAKFRHPLVAFFAVYLLQVLLGVLTLVHLVPVSLGALHQTNAMLLFSAALYVMQTTPRSNLELIERAER